MENKRPQKIYSNYSGRTAQPNTPETDDQERVDHIVTFTVDGVEESMTVWSTDPMSAIETIRRIHAEAI